MAPRATFDSHRRVWCCLVSLAAILLTFPVPGKCAADESEAIMQVYRPLLAEYSREFLKPHGTDGVGFALEKNMASTALQKLFKAELRLMKKDGMGRLDFDPLTGAQDDCGKPLQILGLVREKEVYLMTVSIGCKGVNPFKYVFVKESGRWVIDDVRYDFRGIILTLQNILKGK